MRNNVIKQFKDNGYFTYPFPENLNSDCRYLASLWKHFCQLSIEQKKQYAFFESIGGYEFKDKDSLDFKENFHFSLKGYQHYKEAILNPGTASLLFMQAEKTIRDSFVYVEKMFEIFDQLSGVNMTSMLDINRFTLRFLHYFPRIEARKPSDFLAAPHVDKGMTIHLFETTSGLEVLWDGAWRKAVHDPGKVLGYFGLLGQYYSKSKFPALCHRVAPTPITMKHGRSSIVLFVDFGDVVYDKETWGSTQKVFSSGENYNMPIKEFSKYFKKAL